MIGVCERIEDDLYGIARRIREINPSYFFVRNYRTKKYELHSEGQRGGSLALVLPYDRLDERTVTYTRKSRAERSKQLISEMEAANEKLLRAEIEKIVKKVAR